MADEAAIANLRSFLSQSPEPIQPAPQHDAGTTPAASRPSSLTLALIEVMAAHLVSMRRGEVVDDTGYVALARAVDQLWSGIEDGSTSLDDEARITVAIEERLNAQVLASLTGAATLGLHRVSWEATAARIVQRSGLLRTQRQLEGVRSAVLEFAELHAVSVMPGLIQGQTVEPTTFGHFLGGLIGPLESASRRIETALVDIDRSPYGAGILAGTLLQSDRDEGGGFLGFPAVVPNTWDAVSSVEDDVAASEAIAATVAPIRRFLQEVTVWIRTDPSSLLVTEAWQGVADADAPDEYTTAPVYRLIDALRDVEALASHLVGQLRDAPYGPTPVPVVPFAAQASSLHERAERALSDTRSLLTEGLMVNRAYFANRAGRQLSTARDIATFLIVEEEIPPAAARDIGGLVIRQMREQGLEVTAMTQDMIDSAAMLTIGREIKPEMETMGRFLAPRRYLDRRHVEGSPAPERTREWVRSAQAALEVAERTRRTRSTRIGDAHAWLRRTIRDAASEDTE